MIEREARDEGRRVGEFETTLALAEALGLSPETRIGPALAEVRRLRAERDALRAAVRRWQRARALPDVDEEAESLLALLALLPPEAP